MRDLSFQLLFCNFLYSKHSRLKSSKCPRERKAGASLQPFIVSPCSVGYKTFRFSRPYLFWPRKLGQPEIHCILCTCTPPHHHVSRELNASGECQVYLGWRARVQQAQRCPHVLHYSTFCHAQAAQDSKLLAAPHTPSVCAVIPEQPGSLPPEELAKQIPWLREKITPHCVEQTVWCTHLMFWCCSSPPLGQKAQAAGHAGWKPFTSAVGHLSPQYPPLPPNTDIREPGICWCYLASECRAFAKKPLTINISC